MFAFGTTTHRARDDHDQRLRRTGSGRHGDGRRGRSGRDAGWPRRLRPTALGGPFPEGGAISMINVTALSDSIVAGNASPACRGTIDDGGHNISFGDPSCPGANADPLLEPLADHGGPTLTRRPGSGSPAIDAVPASGAGCEPTDQRLVLRPQGAGCDDRRLRARRAGGGDHRGGPHGAGHGQPERPGDHLPLRVRNDHRVRVVHARHGAPRRRRPRRRSAPSSAGWRRPPPTTSGSSRPTSTGPARAPTGRSPRAAATRPRRCSCRRR